jgi:rfaE bifunctional protein kinase chain/domain
MEEQNLSDVGLIVDDYRLTTQKTRVISGNQHLLRVDEEMDTFLSSRVEKQFIELIHNLLESGGIDSIILQDYDKGILTPKLIKEVGNIASKQSIPVLVDPKYRNFHEYKNLSLFKPNFNELVQGLNVDFKKGDVMKLADACMQFQEENKLEIMMVTLSEHGILTTANGNITHLPAVVRDVTDVSGAGDTVISLAALCLSAGLTSGEVAAISNLAGGQVCEKSGVVPVNYEQLLKECKESFSKK